MGKASRIDKARIVAAMKEQLAAELAVITQAARDAHEAATHEDAKPENEYDTRGLEASYLAGAQLKRATELEQAIRELDFLELKQFGPEDRIQATALVELESEGAKQLCFLVPRGGGLRVEIDKKQITVVTPQAPLGQAMIGKTEGDAFEIPARGSLREYEIVKVW